MLGNSDAMNNANETISTSTRLIIIMFKHVRHSMICQQSLYEVDANKLRPTKASDLQQKPKMDLDYKMGSLCC